MLIIESKRKKSETLQRLYSGAVIADVTSKAGDDLVKLSPFYPHGGDSGAVQRGVYGELRGGGLAGFEGVRGG